MRAFGALGKLVTALGGPLPVEADDSGVTALERGEYDADDLEARVRMRAAIARLEREQRACQAEAKRVARSPGLLREVARREATLERELLALRAEYARVTSFDSTVRRTQFAADVGESIAHAAAVSETLATRVDPEQAAADANVIRAVDRANAALFERVGTSSNDASEAAAIDALALEKYEAYQLAAGLETDADVALAAQTAAARMPAVPTDAPSRTTSARDAESAAGF